MQYLKDNWPGLGVIAIGFAIALTIAFAPLSFLLPNTIPDDAFYYFQIARNIAHGLGSTFDGVTVTNGYHPLWLLLLVPIYKYFSAPVVLDVAPIHAALALSALFHALFGLTLLAVVSRYTKNKWIAALALACWFLNPFNIYAMADGLETPLSLLCIALFFLTAIRYREHSSQGRLAVAGVAGGLMMLARLDDLFYFLLFLAWLLYERPTLRGMREILLVGIVASTVVAPWLLFNYLSFGMFFTSASLAYTLVNHRIIYQDNGYSLYQTLKAVIYMTDYSVRKFLIPQSGAPSSFFMLIGLAGGLLASAEGKIRAYLRRIPLEWFLFGGCALNFVVNASIRWSPREWYFIAFNFFLAVFVAWVLEELRTRGKLRTLPVLAVTFLMLGLYFISWSKGLRNEYKTAMPILAGTQWMNENLPPGATVGAFNAGIVGYFSTHRLINLDGLVNNAAYEAIRDRRVWDYIDSAHVTYIYDDADRIQYRMKSSLGIPDIRDRLQSVHDTPDGPSVYLVK